MRKFAAVAIATALLLSTAGCSFSPAESLQMYAPSDGSQVDLTDGVKARNFIYLSNGTTGALIGSLVNSGTKATEVSLQMTDVNGAKVPFAPFALGAGQKIDFGYNSSPALLVDLQSITGLEAKPGQLVKIYVVSANSSGRGMDVPVVAGILPSYTEFVKTLPTAWPTVAPTVAPSESPIASPSATPAP